MDIVDALRDGFLGSDDHDNGTDYGKLMGQDRITDTRNQIIYCALLGLFSFLTFCHVRPLWPGLYAARKMRQDEAAVLPVLPATFFGWIMPLWKVNDQQVLASAGLDAYVFLAFFKMAIKFLSITFLCALIIIKPVHDAFPESAGLNNGTHNDTTVDHLVHALIGRSINLLSSNHTAPGLLPGDLERDYLWMYLVFAYLFSTIAIYLIYSETRRIIVVRQQHLGTRTTLADRTIRLSGIPPELRDEDKIKEFIESLDIGHVESVTLIREWKELESAMCVRMNILRRLEEAHCIHLGQRKLSPSELEVIRRAQMPAALPHDCARPITSIRYGWMMLHRKQVDAIDYYTEQLREGDEHIMELRQKEYTPTPLAFVTMDSVAACQMAIQAVLDPSPLQLLASQSPSPNDLIWQNTYRSRRDRMTHSWGITVFIAVLTVVWSVALIPIAAALNVDVITRWIPVLGEFLKHHQRLLALAQVQLPTLVATILTTIVPYLYYSLSARQGMISQGEVELSSISKNFFFTFFNFFVVFTILGTASKSYSFFDSVGSIGEIIDSPRLVANTLASELQRLLTFYVNFIILQGIGLFPFRLLEVGSLAWYPIYLLGAKTPRDYAELVQPPVFSYGFYLPYALLIFIICMVYSVLRSSWQVLLAGLAYFFLGHFVYKYQLLYAMDHRPHSTGRAWTMICDRIFVGLIFFQLTTTGQLLLKSALKRSILMLPLLVITMWVASSYGRTYKPLMTYIALRSVERGDRYSDSAASEQPDSADGDDVPLEPNVWDETEGAAHDNQTFALDGEPDIGKTPRRFLYPGLIQPLDKIWIGDKGDGKAAFARAVVEEYAV